MLPDASLLFRSRGEFAEAVLTAIAASRRELVLLDRDFADWPLERPAGCAALGAFLAAEPHARIRLLVGDPTWLETHASRFVALRRRHPAAIECRQVPTHLFTAEGLVLGDRRHVLRRAHGDFFRGRLTLGDPSAGEPVAARCDALWDESTPCLPPTVLGL